MVILWEVCEGGIRVRVETVYVELLKQKRMDTRPRAGQRQAGSGRIVLERTVGWREEEGRLARRRTVSRCGSVQGGLRR
jgi:hypothetical protein